MSHLCKVRGCPLTVADWLLMCRKHWLQVPRQLRNAVSNAYARRHQDRKALAEAQRAAIESIEAHHA